jgi:hypothetical protein
MPGSCTRTTRAWRDTQAVCVEGSETSCHNCCLAVSPRAGQTAAGTRNGCGLDRSSRLLAHDCHSQHQASHCTTATCTHIHTPLVCCCGPAGPCRRQTTKRSGPLVRAPTPGTLGCTRRPRQGVLSHRTPVSSKRNMVGLVRHDTPMRMCVVWQSACMACNSSCSRTLPYLGGLVATAAALGAGLEGKAAPAAARVLLARVLAGSRVSCCRL